MKKDELVKIEIVKDDAINAALAMNIVVRRGMNIIEREVHVLDDGTLVVEGYEIPYGVEGEPPVRG